MNDAEIIHTILQVTHVAKEILRHLAGRLDSAWWGQRGTIHGVRRGIGDRLRWWRMTSKVSWDQDEEQGAHYRNHGEEVGI